jgi:Rad3-related DNA helicase
VVDVKENLVVGILKKESVYQFNFEYENPNTKNLFDDFGNILCRLSGNIPQGILVIFRSYSFMEKCRQQWLSSQIY